MVNQQEHISIKPYGDENKSKKEEIARMFDNIAPKYDLLNHLLSMGIDRGWRKKAIRQLEGIQLNHLLDVATGTGDFAISALVLNPLKITGIDISEGMLKAGRDKIKKLKAEDKIELVNADSEKIPFPDNTFDAATVAFGVRNFENLDLGLKEINRVLKPGGRLVILEFSRPVIFPVKQLFELYSKYLLPLVGRLVSRDRAAYTYLPESVEIFPAGNAFLERLSSAGFSHNISKPLTFGIASIYSGIKEKAL